MRYKLDKIKNEKNDEINRLKANLSALKNELSASNLKNDEKLVADRNQLVEETENRIVHVRKLTLDIENALLEEIRNLNEIVQKKDKEINYLLEFDKKQIEENEQIQKDLKNHINRLQDKIFRVQREDEIELFTTVDRLQKQYEKNTK